MISIHTACAATLATLALGALGCGSSTSSSASSSGSGGSSASGSGPSTSTPGALSGEAGAAATGDIPDNQVFLVFTNRAAAYSIKYPEGWTQRGSGNDVTFQSKNNQIHVIISHSAAPTTASVATQLEALKRSNPALTFTAPKMVRVGSSQAIKASYTTQSVPNQVTGKRVTLKVDRYELASAGRLAVVDLGTQVGVDNVDAYRRIASSFRWR